MFVENFSKPAFAAINLVASYASVGEAGAANLDAAVDLSGSKIS